MKELPWKREEGKRAVSYISQPAIEAIARDPIASG